MSIALFSGALVPFFDFSSFLPPRGGRESVGCAHLHSVKVLHFYRSNFEPLKHPAKAQPSISTNDGDAFQRFPPSFRLFQSRRKADSPLFLAPNSCFDSSLVISKEALFFLDLSDPSKGRSRIPPFPTANTNPPDTGFPKWQVDSFPSPSLVRSSPPKLTCPCFSPSNPGFIQFFFRLFPLVRLYSKFPSFFFSK